MAISKSFPLPAFMAGLFFFILLSSCGSKALWVDLKIEGPFDPELRGIVQEILFQNQSWKINVQSDDGSDWQIILKPGHSDVELPKLPLELIYERKNSPAGPATLLSFFRDGEAVLFIGDRQGFL